MFTCKFTIYKQYACFEGCELMCGFADVAKHYSDDIGFRIGTRKALEVI